MKKPKISILIAFYNAEKFIYESLESILNQTYTNIEILLLDDGSTDNSYEIVKQVIDKRITLNKNQTNKGLNYTINKLIDMATGEYIAIMDADDIANKDRLLKQLIFLNNEKLDLCGTSLEFFGASKNYVQTKLSKDNDIKLLMTIGNPMANPSILIKSSLIKKYKYSMDYVSADYELWTRLAIDNYKFGNCKEPLLKYRVHSKQDSIVKYDIGRKESLKISKRYSSIYLKNFKSAIYLENIDYGFKQNINPQKLIKSFISFKKIIIKLNASDEILKIFIYKTLLKIYPLNYRFIYLFSLFCKKNNISIFNKYYLYLYINLFLGLKNDNYLLKKIINIYGKYL